MHLTAARRAADPGITPAPPFLFLLFYQVEIRYRQLLQSQSDTAHVLECPESITRLRQLRVSHRLQARLERSRKMTDDIENRPDLNTGAEWEGAKGYPGGWFWLICGGCQRSAGEGSIWIFWIREIAKFLAQMGPNSKSLAQNPRHRSSTATNRFRSRHRPFSLGRWNGPSCP